MGGVGGTVGGLVALCFVLVAYLSLYLVQEGLGDDLGFETYANATGFSSTRSTPKPFFVMWTLHCGYTVFLFVLMPLYQTYLLCARMPLLEIPVRNLLLAALFNAALLTSDYLWSLSLVYTNPAPNAAIFQSLGAVVYAMSLIPTSIPLPLKSTVRALSPALDTWFCSPLWRAVGVTGLSKTCCASKSKGSTAARLPAGRRSGCDIPSLEWRGLPAPRARGACEEPGGACEDPGVRRECKEPGVARAPPAAGDEPRPGTMLRAMSMPWFHRQRGPGRGAGERGAACIVARRLGRDDLADLPPQLYFVHQGQRDIKEVHWHKQLPGVLGSTAGDSFHIFKPANSGDGATEA